MQAITFIQLKENLRFEFHAIDDVLLTSAYVITASWEIDNVPKSIRHLIPGIRKTSSVEQICILQYEIYVDIDM